MLVVLITILVFVAVAFIALCVYDWISSKMRIRHRLDSMAAETPVEQVIDQRIPDELLPTVASILSSRGFTDRLLLALGKAGLKLRPSEFVGIVSGIVLIMSLLAGIIFKSIWAMVVAPMIGLLGVFIYIKILQQRRLAAFINQLPDALSLISSAIRTGYSFARAMQMVSEEMPQPISYEFERAINEVNVGMSLQVALKRMAARIGNYDLELLVTAVCIQQEVGGNLAEIIEHIDSTIRDRIKVHYEIGVLTAEGRLSGIILIAMPFLLAAIVLIANPGYIKPLLIAPWGKWLILGGLCLQGIGVMIIRQMLRVEY